MTPEEARDIFYKACKVEYGKHLADYSPVNQDKVNLAGYQGVIDAVTEEVQGQETIELVNRYLDCSQKP